MYSLGIILLMNIFLFIRTLEIVKAFKALCSKYFGSEAGFPYTVQASLKFLGLIRKLEYFILDVHKNIALQWQGKMSTVKCFFSRVF